MTRVALIAVALVACSSASERDVADSAPTTTVPTPSNDVATEAASSDVASELVEADTTLSEDIAAPEPWPTGCAAVPSVIDTISVPEASGAARLSDGRVLVVADSGNAGRAVVIDLARAGAEVALTLPLGEGAGDDVEGLETAPDGRVWGLTSAGWLRAWRVTAGASVEAALEVGPVPVAPEGEWRCGASAVNCGPNYEGFCLHPAPAVGACAGWAASKARGVLVCLVAADGAYVVDPARTIAVGPADQLSGCAYEPEAPHRLVVAGNLFSGSTLWEVDEASGRVAAWTAIGAANQESVIVLAAGAVHSFGDLQTLTPDSSPHIALRCPAGAPRVESRR